jgi:hypothetical protein
MARQPATAADIPDGDMSFMSQPSARIAAMNPSPPLAVDTAAAAARPTADAVRGWAAEQRVFVSSVMGGMRAEREAAVRAIEALGAEPVWFEGFGGRDDDAEVAYLSEVATSTVYVGVLGREYGRIQKTTRRSATHDEYREAERLGLRIRAFARADGDLVGDQATFLDEIRQFHVTADYRDPDHLHGLIADALRWIAAEDLAPWCKVGDAVFRARRVRDDGKTVVVDAAVHDPAVLATLEGLRAGQWGRPETTRATYRGQSYAVRAREIMTTTTASRAQEVALVLDRDDNRGQSYTTQIGSYNVQGRTYTAHDLTEIALRQSLFGTPAPDGLLSLSGGIGDPVGRLPRGLTAETYRAVVTLLVTEALVETGRASRVDRVLVSPPGPDGRRVLVEWTAPAAHGQPSATRTVDGYIPG